MLKKYTLRRLQWHFELASSMNRKIGVDTAEKEPREGPSTRLFFGRAEPSRALHWQSRPPAYVHQCFANKDVSHRRLDKSPCRSIPQVSICPRGSLWKENTDRRVDFQFNADRRGIYSIRFWVELQKLQLDLPFQKGVWEMELWFVY